MESSTSEGKNPVSAISSKIDRVTDVIPCSLTPRGSATRSRPQRKEDNEMELKDVLVGQGDDWSVNICRVLQEFFVFSYAGRGIAGGEVL